MTKDSYADQYAKLQEILDWFEGDKFDLDKAEQKFNQGIAIAAALEKRLRDSRLKVERLEDRLKRQ